MSSCALDDRGARHLLRHVLLVPSSGRVRPLSHAVSLPEEKAIQASAKVQLRRSHDIHGGHEGAGTRDAVPSSRIQGAPRTDRRLSGPPFQQTPLHACIHRYKDHLIRRPLRSSLA